MQVKGCCPLDCQDSCSWVAHVAMGADGDRVVRVEGAKDHPITRGVLCAKVRDYETRVTAAERLLRPLRRVGAKGSGAFEPISWDEALDTIAARFKAIIAEHGAEALLPFQYLGSMGVVQRFALLRIFHALGASLQGGTVCGASASALLADGHPMNVDPEETPHARLILLWGQNVLTTCHHQWHFIEQARANGARVIAIDPRPDPHDQDVRRPPGAGARLRRHPGGGHRPASAGDRASRSRSGRSVGGGPRRLSQDGRALDLRGRCSRRPALPSRRLRSWQRPSPPRGRP